MRWTQILPLLILALLLVVQEKLSAQWDEQFIGHVWQPYDGQLERLPARAAPLAATAP